MVWFLSIFGVAVTGRVVNQRGSADFAAIVIAHFFRFITLTMNMQTVAIAKDTIMIKASRLFTYCSPLFLLVDIHCSFGLRIPVPPVIDCSY
jgi:hypothetical protein